MNKKLFTNNLFKIIFIIIVGIDLINSTMKISEDFKTISILIFRSLNLIICILSLISFFIITKYSLPILKLYIVFRLLVFPLFFILSALKDFIFYSSNRFDLEDYISMFSTLIIGIILYFFFNKYKFKENEEQAK